MTRLPTPAFIVIRTAKYLATQVRNQSIREKKDAARQGAGAMTDVFDMLRKFVGLPFSLD
jgi:hypothetical protein